MILFKISGQLISHLELAKKKQLSLGFVPTMGALHEGHISLIRECKNLSDLTICSIFINPTQFNNQADFEKYPVSIADDILSLEQAGCDILFLPSVSEMYPGGTSRLANYDLGYLETILEGKFRPGHFQGVCNIVDRLLDVVSPDKLFLGQKDFQQVMVIKEMVSQRTHKETEIIVAPTLREDDGLAMSSRNRRLNAEQREKAPAIYQELLRVSEKIGKDEIVHIKEAAKANLEQKGLVVDYIEIADSKSLLPVEEWDDRTEMVVLAAAWLDDIRLIDNIIINPERN